MHQRTIQPSRYPAHLRSSVAGAPGWITAALVLSLVIGAGERTAFAEAQSSSRKGAIRTVAVRPTRTDAAMLAASAHLASTADGEISLVLDLPRAVDIEASYLADPKRLIIDLPQVSFSPSGDAAPEAGPIAAWRLGLFASAGSRIVLDLRSPAVFERIETLPTPLGVRMVIMIKPASADRFEAAAEKAAAARATGATRSQRRPETTDVAQASPSEHSGSVTTAQATVAAAAQAALPLVIIDPGHGGIDVGATGPGGEVEKSLVLDIGLLLKKKLEETGKVRVEMTRDSDVFVPLPQRVRIARDRFAALFISIHADTLVGEPAVRGATVYTLSDKASDASAARLAEKENKADQIAGLDATEDKEDVSGILFDLARRETRQFSLGFAKGLMARLQGATPINKNPHRFAGFRVLKAPDVPSVLLEIGYLSSAEDVKLITSRDWQEKITASASDAITRFLAQRGQDQGAGQSDIQ